MAPPKGALKGRKRPAGAGRKKGQPNKLSRAAKDAYAHVFDALGGAEGLLEWAQTDPANLRDFYNWHTKLLPIEHSGKLDVGNIPKLTDAELDAQAKALGLE